MTKGIVSEHAQLEPGFAGVILVIVALFVLFMVASGRWRQLGLAWQELWETGQSGSAPAPKSGHGSGEPFFWKYLPWGQKPSAAPSAPQWTPGLESVRFGVSV